MGMTFARSIPSAPIFWPYLPFKTIIWLFECEKWYLCSLFLKGWNKIKTFKQFGLLSFHENSAFIFSIFCLLSFGPPYRAPKSYFNKKKITRIAKELRKNPHNLIKKTILKIQLTLVNIRWQTANENFPGISLRGFGSVWMRRWSGWRAERDVVLADITPIFFCDAVVVV